MTVIKAPVSLWPVSACDIESKSSVVKQPATILVNRSATGLPVGDRTTGCRAVSDGSAKIVGDRLVIIVSDLSVSFKAENPMFFAWQSPTVEVTNRLSRQQWQSCNQFFSK